MTIWWICFLRKTEVVPRLGTWGRDPIPRPVPRILEVRPWHRLTGGGWRWCHVTIMVGWLLQSQGRPHAGSPHPPHSRNADVQASLCDCTVHLPLCERMLLRSFGDVISPTRSRLAGQSLRGVNRYTLIWYTLRDRWDAGILRCVLRTLRRHYVSCGLRSEDLEVGPYTKAGPRMLALARHEWRYDGSVFYVKQKSSPDWGPGGGTLYQGRYLEFSRSGHGIGWRGVDDGDVM